MLKWIGKKKKDGSESPKNIRSETLQELQRAAYGGDLAGLKKLLKKGVEVNCKDKDGRTPLYFAAYQGHSQIVDALIEKGANLELKDNEGSTALHKAIINKHIETARLLLGHGADKDACDTLGRCPVHFAAFNGDLDAAKLLIDKGSRLDSVDEEGRTPLHWAVYNGHLALSSLFLKTASPKLANAEDNGGRTPLIYAAHNGFLECVNVLLNKGADVTIKDKEGKTAIDHAIAGNHKEILSLLTTALADKRKKEGPKKEEVLVFELDESDDDSDVKTVWQAEKANKKDAPLQPLKTPELGALARPDSPPASSIPVSNIPVANDSYLTPPHSPYVAPKESRKPDWGDSSDSDDGVIGFDQPNSTPPSVRRTPVVESTADAKFGNASGNYGSGSSASNLREFDDNEEAEKYLIDQINTKPASQTYSASPQTTKQPNKATGDTEADSTASSISPTITPRYLLRAQQTYYHSDSSTDDSSVPLSNESCHRGMVTGEPPSNDRSDTSGSSGFMNGDERKSPNNNSGTSHPISSKNHVRWRDEGDAELEEELRSLQAASQKYKATIEQLQKELSEEKKASSTAARDIQKFKFVSEESAKDLKVALEAKRVAEEGWERERTNNKALQDRLNSAGKTIEQNQKVDEKRWEGERRFLKERTQQLETELNKLEEENGTLRAKEAEWKEAKKREQVGGDKQLADMESGMRELRNQIDELELEKRRLQQKIDEQDRQIDNMAEEVEDTRKTIQKQLQETEVERRGIKQKAEEMEIEKKSFKRKLEEHMENEYKNFREKLASVDAERKTLKQKLDIHESEKRQFEKKLENIEEGKREVEQRFENFEESAREKIAELQSENRLLKDKLEIQKANMTRRPEQGMGGDSERRLKERVEELEAERRGLKEKVERLEADRKAWKEKAEVERQSMRERIEFLETERHALREKADKAEGELEQLLSEKKLLREKMEDERKGWRDKYDMADGERKMTRDKIKELESETQELHRRVEELERERGRLVRALEEVHSQKGRRGGGGNRMDAGGDTTLGALGSDLNRELSDKMQQKKQKITTIKAQLENTKRQFQQERIVLDSAITTLKDERAKLSAELVQAKEKTFVLKRTNSQIESEKSQLMLKLSQQDNLARSSAKYDILVMERDEALIELEALKQKLEERKEQINRLEHQNIQAREAQEELQEMQHHTRVLTQRLEEQRREVSEERARSEAEKKRATEKLFEKTALIDSLLAQITEKEQKIAHINFQNITLSREVEMLKQQVDEERDLAAGMSRAGLTGAANEAYHHYNLKSPAVEAWIRRLDTPAEVGRSGSKFERLDDKDRMIEELRDEVKRTKEKYRSLKSHSLYPSHNYSSYPHHSTRKHSSKYNSHYHANAMVITDADGNVVMDPDNLTRTVEELRDKVKKIKRCLPDYM